MATVTCRTDECAMYGTPVDLPIYHENEDGEWVRVDAVMCGGCGQEITDIREEEDS